jgi:SulP family sulfate permease
MLAKVFPFLAWFKNYDKASLQLDALSGLTVALVLIPNPWHTPSSRDCPPITDYTPLFCRR